MSTPKQQLNRDFLEKNLLGKELAPFTAEILDYPEKIIQFGEGNFLRGFVDWMVHQLNKQSLFQGRVVVAQPIPSGRVAELNQQDGLYTLILRGTQDGQVVDQREIITSISRGLDPYTQWQEVLKCAENPAIEYVVSNTTEAGIAYNPADRSSDQPPVSFPGKLTAYLYHRYQHFQGDATKGMVILPCELIDRNGDNLKRVVLQLAAEWNLPLQFQEWLTKANHFLNTLVDRIVTGYPAKEMAQLQEELGYTDQNMDTGEIFHLWVIEGDAALGERLPFTKAGLNVKWVKDMTPYRTRKVRILNGAHTSTVAVAYLAGIDLVRDAVHDQKVGQFLKQAVFEEIIPTLDLEKSELQQFAAAVLERFDNPFIDHKWSDISLNSTSKFEARVMPSLKKYFEKQRVLPKRMTFSLAALFALYYGTEIRDNKLVGHRNGKEYFVQDDLPKLEFFRDVWQKYEKAELSLEQAVAGILTRFWPQEAQELPTLASEVAFYLQDILNSGIVSSLEKCS
ncbi:tagaturonate reductase [Hydrogenispora ethanolica]|jgi:tagaturonate reductase|uniref:Tagaturonate reductase n=1 Tax=Hydrogenispora ethanolica TaxID=1082276 RepID=A0A4V2QF79_HYDET|nr:tagaturonate reductase [Hydrogenispora ethanolica]TCL70887.1 tagaturonate reductase [Hydrogenispora ethanolica]